MSAPMRLNTQIQHYTNSIFFRDFTIKYLIDYIIKCSAVTHYSTTVYCHVE